MSNKFKLEKLNITAVKGGESFEVMFNPESYSLKHCNEFAPSQAINSSGKEQVFIYSEPDSLDLTLLFDSSAFFKLRYNSLSSSENKNAPSLKNPPVQEQINKFLALATEMDGSAHEPHQLQIQWGELNFQGYLKEVEVTYTLFNRDGTPSRAQVDASFIAHIDDATRVKEEGKESPDVTHNRIIPPNTKLSLLAREIYGDPAYYLKVAEANQLNHFRKLKPGRELSFPPIAEG